MDRSSVKDSQTHATGAQLMAKGLKNLGITRVFGLCGDQVNSIFNALNAESIQIVGTHHETAAIHMADAWARATGEVAVAVVTGGPGHTNAVTGLGVAFGAGSPVMVISGQAPVDKRDRGGTQVLRQADIVEPVTKFAREILDVRLIPEMLYRAYLSAISPTPGPVSLSVPVDVFNAQTEGYEASFRVIPRRSNFATVTSVNYELERARALIAEAVSPVVIVGSGAHWAADPQEIPDALVELGIPVFTSELARGLVPDDGELCFGYADPRFNRAFRNVEHADLVILIGCSFDFHTLFGKPPLFASGIKVLQIIDDPQKASYCRTSDLVLCGDIAKLTVQLSKDAGPVSAKVGTSWRDNFKNAHLKSQQEFKDSPAQNASSDGVHPLLICQSIARHLTEDTGLVVDVGDFVHWPRVFFGARKRGHFIDGSIMGTLGAALPQAIGMQLAFPSDPVLAFMGDGGFTQGSWELSTAVEQQLPIKLVIGNDAAWGVELRLQEAEFGSSVGCLLPEYRLDHFATMVGAKGIFVENQNELDAAVDEMMRTDGPCLLNIRIPRRSGRPLSDIAIPM